MSDLHRSMDRKAFRRFIRKILIDIYPVEGMSYHIEINREGPTRYSIPYAEESDVIKLSFFDCNTGFWEAVDFFLYDDDKCRREYFGKGLHWRIRFYITKGFYHGSEGWEGEDECRREYLNDIVASIEEAADIDLGSIYLINPLEVEEAEKEKQLLNIKCPVCAKRVRRVVWGLIPDGLNERLYFRGGCCIFGDVRDLAYYCDHCRSFLSEELTLT